MESGGEKRRALIAMSGGVDSSVSAWLMHQAGYDCAGARMRLFKTAEPDGRSDEDEAADAARRMGMPFTVLDYSALFREQVIDAFQRAYERGLTPNPCVDCNRGLKFGAMLDYARREGFDCLATGHYARVSRDEASGRWQLRKALDTAKDQSYVLYMLRQEQLERICFPLGVQTKEQTRRIAESFGLLNARKRDSQDICFIPDGDYAAFLERLRGEAYPAGDFVSLEGGVVGRHKGAVRYTLGQRRGLELPMGERIYVCAKDMERNTVTVGPESALYRRELLAGGVNWLSVPEPTGPLRVTARTRYRQTERAATVWPMPGERLRLVFDEPQRAITAGQAVVLYDGDLVLAGGTILPEGSE